MDVAGHRPRQPTGPLAWQAVLLGWTRTHRPGMGVLVTTLTIEQLGSTATDTITAEIPIKFCSAVNISKY